MTTVTDNYKVRVSQTGAKQTEAAMKRLGKSVTNLALAYFGTTGLIRAVSSVIKLYAEQEAAEKRLMAVSGRHFQTLKDHAAALQRVSMHGDEVIMANQRLLIQLGAKTPEQVKKGTQAAIELSSVLGMDLTGATKLVGQAMNGNVATLGRYLRNVNKLTKAQIENGEAIQFIIDELGGAAEAETDTLTGSMRQAEMAAGDLAEKFGGDTGIGPLAKYAADQITALTTTLGKFTEASFKASAGMLISTIMQDPATALEMFGKGGLKGAMKGIAGGDVSGAIEGFIGGGAEQLGTFVGLLRAEMVKSGLLPEAEGEGFGGIVEGKGKKGGKPAEAIVSKEIMQMGIDHAVELDEKKRELLNNRLAYERELTEAFQAAETEAWFAAAGAKLDAEADLLAAKGDAHKQSLEMMRIEKENAMDMAVSVSGAASSMAQSLGSLVQNIAGQNSAAAEGAQKFMLFLSGAAAVTEGVVSILKAKANAMTSYGASLAQIPFGLALIAKGGIMMGGSFLSSGDTSGGGGGGIGGFSHYGGMGNQAGGMQTVVINVNSGIVHDEGGLGKSIQGALDRAKLEGRIR